MVLPALWLEASALMSIASSRRGSLCAVGFPRQIPVHLRFVKFFTGPVHSIGLPNGSESSPFLGRDVRRPACFLCCTDALCRNPYADNGYEETG
jgi:hypothetical protein